MFLEFKSVCLPDEMACQKSRDVSYLNSKTLATILARVARFMPSIINYELYVVF